MAALSSFDYESKGGRSKKGWAFVDAPLTRLRLDPRHHSDFVQTRRLYARVAEKMNAWTGKRRDYTRWNIRKKAINLKQLEDGRGNSLPVSELTDEQVRALEDHRKEDPPTSFSKIASDDPLFKGFTEKAVRSATTRVLEMAGRAGPAK